MPFMQACCISELKRRPPKKIVKKFHGLSPKEASEKNSPALNWLKKFNRLN